MRLSNYELETIVNFNEGDANASVYTHCKPLQRRLEKLVAERPSECRKGQTSHSGMAIDFVVPKSWIKIKPPRVLSEAQKAASRAAIAKARLSRENI